MAGCRTTRCSRNCGAIGGQWRAPDARYWTQTEAIGRFPRPANQHLVRLQAGRTAACLIIHGIRGKMADMNVAYSPAHGLGEEQSIWFKLTPLLNQENPMQVLMALSDKYGGVIPVNLKNQRVILLAEPAHAERVLVSNANNYTKYFDGLRPIFGKSMITVDGALWQRIRAPQQAAFHPNMFEVYFPYLMDAIRSKMGRWQKFSETFETIEMVEETWTLAADMVCKALFDREMPFNPHFVFSQVKTYTDVMNHKSIRLKNVRGELEEVSEEDAAKAMKVWGSIPDTVIGAGVLEHREKTLLRMLENAEAD